MSKVESLRVFVNQRLSAAAEEIFGLFVRTIAEYEEQLCRSEEENKRQQKLLDAALNPQLLVNRAEVQQLSPSKEDVSSEQQGCSLSLDQEDTPHVKEEQEEVWSSKEGPGEVYTTEFPFTSLSVKSEDGGVKPQTSQLHPIQSEQMETGADGEDCGEHEAARTSDPETQDKNEGTHEFKTDVSEDWRETAEHQPTLNYFENFEGQTSNIDKKSHSCSECSERFYLQGHLLEHMSVHQKEKPFSCSDCGKRFKCKSHLSTHMVVHTGEKPFGCFLCGKRFNQNSNLTKHMVIHTGERPYSCSVCYRRFSWSKQLKRHKCIGGQAS